MATLNVPNEDLKMLRETLCTAQGLIVRYASPRHDWRGDSDRIQTLINEIDRHRPLGPDGKHGQRHTETCGCEDKPQVKPKRSCVVEYEAQ